MVWIPVWLVQRYGIVSWRVEGCAHLSPRVQRSKKQQPWCTRPGNGGGSSSKGTGRINLLCFCTRPHGIGWDPLIAQVIFLTQFTDSSADLWEHLQAPWEMVFHQLPEHPLAQYDQHISESLHGLSLYVLGLIDLHNHISQFFILNK